jgi:hypothetical protein
LLDIAALFGSRARWNHRGSRRHANGLLDGMPGWPIDHPFWAAIFAARSIAMML